ncbi:hypothetical protein SO802_028484 [Lithocarpus litseifolius]|uniref:GRF-type domain-containing protein n=1 Tax=Lithocarpus litseifolius TaxID=425828 RepID=A0AAW2BVV5_9ROSI
MVRRSTVGLHVPWISSPLSALQDLATNQDFLAAEANGRRCHFNTDNSRACGKSRCRKQCILILTIGFDFEIRIVLCGLRASVKISDKRNENQYRLFQCCPRDKCGFFQWCIPLKTLMLYAEDFQQLQVEMCVLREELRVMHDKQ